MKKETLVSAKDFPLSLTGPPYPYLMMPRPSSLASIENKFFFHS